MVAPGEQLLEGIVEMLVEGLAPVVDKSDRRGPGAVLGEQLFKLLLVAFRACS